MSKKLVFIPAFLLALTVCAMDGDDREHAAIAEKSTETKEERGDEPKDGFYTREQYGAKRPKKEDKRREHETEKASFITIGHTVTFIFDEKKKAIPTILAIQQDCQDRLGWDDFPYNRFLCRDGFQYEGRALDVAPALVYKKNAGSCGVGIVGRCDVHPDAIKVTDKLVAQWGMQLARLSKELGFKELVRVKDKDLNKNWQDIQDGKANICGMSNISEKYPISPGQGFMDRFDDILRIANQILQAQ